MEKLDNNLAHPYDINFNGPNDSDYMICISIDDPYDDLEQLHDIDSVIIPENKLNMHFVYPFKQEHVFEFKHNGGFTKRKLIIAICEQFGIMYNDINKYETVVSDLSLLLLHSMSVHHVIVNGPENKTNYSVDVYLGVTI